MKKELLGLFLLLFISCSKEFNIDKLPDETQEGKNTFGCYINNKLLVTGTTLFGQVSPVNVNYFFDSIPRFRAGSLFIQGIDARYSLDIAGFIAIQKMDVFKTGDYSLKFINDCKPDPSCDASFYYNSKLNRNFFAESGKLTITKLDTVNKIVAGRFNFIAIDSFGNKKEITNGRFDTKFTN